MTRPKTRANAGDAETPPPAAEAEAKRHKPLDSLDRVRRELSSVYWAAKDGAMQLDRAKGLAYLLSQLVVVLRADSADDDLTKLLAEARDRLKGEAR